MQLASRMNCEVEFMHAFISPSGSETIQLSDAYDYELEDMELTSRMQQQAETLMKRFAHTVRDDIKSGLLPAVKFSTIVSEGIPEEVILSYTREEKPLMVVMSTREAGKKETELIGSVTAEVLDRCRVPAFTVPENTDFDLFGKHERVAFFCNLDQEDMLALDSLYRLFPDIHLDVTLISVPPRRMRQTPPTQAADNLLKYCREHYAGYTFSVEYIKTHSVFDDLDNIATRKPFDMICLPQQAQERVRPCVQPITRAQDSVPRRHPNGGNPRLINMPAALRLLTLSSFTGCDFQRRFFRLEPTPCLRLITEMAGEQTFDKVGGDADAVTNP